MKKTRKFLVPIILILIFAVGIACHKFYSSQKLTITFSKQVNEQILKNANHYKIDENITMERAQFIGAFVEDYPENLDKYVLIHVNGLVTDNHGDIYYINYQNRVKRTSHHDTSVKRSKYEVFQMILFDDPECISVTTLKIESVKKFSEVMEQHLPQMEGKKLKSNFVYSVSDLHFDEEKYEISFCVWQNALYTERGEDNVEYRSKHLVTLVCSEEEFGLLRNNKNKILSSFINYFDDGLIGEKYRVSTLYETTELNLDDGKIFSYKKLPLKFR
ncbi:MAG: hypothetical protein IKL79_05675 [Clostridia bacterium]|nr:hypothetical protein [Clostridia bacterium]